MQGCHADAVVPASVLSGVVVPAALPIDAVMSATGASDAELRAGSSAK